MNAYRIIDVNIFLSLALLILIAVIRLKLSYRSYSSRLFLLLCWSTILMLIVDALPWLVDGIPGVENHWMPYATNFLLYLFQPLPITVWVCYLDYQLYMSPDRLKKRWYYLHAFFLGAAVMIVSAFTDFVFYVDAENFYHRGPGMYLMMGIYFGLIAFSFILVFAHRERVDQRVFRIIVFFGIIPVAGTVLQTFFYGTCIIWPSVALAVFFVYIFLETQKEIRDYLTGLLNRQQIDDFLRARIRDFGRRGSFSLIMLDLDDFKGINDNYGHKEGDRALIKVASILSSSVKGIDKVARFGGDEFLILVESGNPENVEKVIQRIRTRIAQENRRCEHPYRISVSAGYAVYSPQRHPSVNDVLHAADQDMYAAKQHA